MKTTQLLLLVLFLFGIQSVNAQSDIQLISNTLMDYIEGTSNGDPDRVRKAFHPDLNLYSVAGDSLRIWNGENYISGFEVGKKNSRKGRIISIDHENDAATAKVEIDIPGRAIYTDYFLLLKYEGEWKIIHKSFTTSFVYPKQ